MPFHLFLQVPGHAPKEYELPTQRLDSTDTALSFELKGYAGRGGNGGVFVADAYQNGRFVRRCAVKILKELYPSRVDRFDNEVRILQQLNHERIAAYYSQGQITLPPEHHGPGGKVMPWVAMELGGYNLRRAIEESGPLRGERFLQAVRDMCDALEYLHAQNLIHRDIKPDNFVFDQSAPNRIKMIDFGIAKYVGEDVAGRPFDDFTKAKEFVGPQQFFSTELLGYARDKSTPVDLRSDLFQLGKVMWFLATGIVSAGRPSRRADPFGGPLHALVDSLLCDDPADRPQTVGDVRAALPHSATRNG